MFESIIEKAAGEFDLPADKARGLVGMLVSRIFDWNSGGTEGFLDAFHTRGLGDVVSSWLGTGINRLPISPRQLESVIGSNVLGGIAARLGLPAGTVGSAAAAILPDLVGSLTEGSGRFPASLPMGFGNRFGDLPGEFASFGKTTVGSTVASTLHVMDGEADLPRGGFVGRLLPWVLLVGLTVLSLWLLRACEDEAATTRVARESAPSTDTSLVRVAGSAAPARSVEAASAALDALAAAGAFTGNDLVRALNLTVLHFDTGSARISADSDDILERAAIAIQRAPADLRIEVQGHTDNTGATVANQPLSEARAVAVVERLTSLGVAAGMLASKGYGQSVPVADNATEAGRAQNRRIDFAIVR